MITQQELKDLLDYDPLTGLFRWHVVGQGWRRRNSNLAGSIKEGRVVLRIKGKMYKAHRLAWLYMTGSWPNGIMDHKNRDGTDNRFSNLREATASQSLANRMSNRKQGLKGTTFHKKGNLWNARVKKDGKEISLGYFKTAEEAHQAYKEAAIRIHGEFAFTDY